MNVLSSILVNDGESIDDNHCSPRKNKDKCFKIQDGLPCSTLLGGKVEKYFIQSNFFINILQDLCCNLIGRQISILLWVLSHQRWKRNAITTMRNI